jgi:hypothetical protein
MARVAAAARAGKKNQNDATRKTRLQPDYITAAKRYLGSERWANELANIVRLCSQMASGHQWWGTATNRRRDIAYAIKAANRLQIALGRVNLRQLVAAMGEPDSTASREEPDTPRSQAPELSSTPARLTELELFMGRLRSIQAALVTIHDREPEPREGRPRVDDALLFAVEALEALWAQARGEIKRGATGGLEALAETVFAAAPLNYKPGQASYAIRQLYELRVGSHRPGPRSHARP